MKKIMKALSLPFCMVVVLTMLSCNNVHETGESANYVKITFDREIDTTYTPQKLVETFYSMLTFRDHTSAIDLFEVSMDCPDYALEDLAKENEMFLNAHTPVTYNVTSVELSPDSNRAKITAVLQMANGVNRTEYLTAIKTKTHGWRLLGHIDGANDEEKQKNAKESEAADRSNDNKSKSAPEIQSICNTKWTFTDAHGNKFVLYIKGMARDGESAKTELEKNGTIVEYNTIEPKYRDSWKKTGFMGYGFGSGTGSASETRIYFESSDYLWLSSALWDYEAGLLYSSRNAYEAEAKTHLKIQKAR